ncbi:MAG: DUF2161 family putative PD-(D/E)XK-type phosphodiesterase [Spirochaetota bacterium]
MTGPSPRESDLYEPLRQYLEGQGYTVYAEVRDCDLVARRAAPETTAPLHDEPPDDELIVVELKRRLSLDLVVQATLRKEFTDSVYVAVPLQGSAGRVRNLSGVKGLLARLEIGLIVVRFLRSGTRIEVVAHPRPFTPRVRHRRRIGVIREIDGRYAEFDRAGQASTEERITAYRQQSLYLAHLLREHGEQSPAQLRALGASERAGTILSKNLYGWFDRVRRGVYDLDPAGAEALGHYDWVVQKILQGRR